MPKKIPLLTIGFPVYNGEKFMKNVLNALLQQTFVEYELIISDNASTDNTEKICKEYLEKDSRITYIRQKRNIGGSRNFEVLLKKAKTKYFMWAAADDILEPTFVEKNIKVLENNENIVGSISNIDFYGENKEKFNGKGQNLMFRHVLPFQGTFKNKASAFLKFRSASAIYSIFRTESLKRSYVNDYLVLDFMNVLSILQEGDLHVIKETLLHRYSGGESRGNIISVYREHGNKDTEIMLITKKFMIFSIKKLGLKFIIKNLKSYIMIHIVLYGRIIRSLKYSI